MSEAIQEASDTFRRLQTLLGGFKHLRRLQSHGNSPGQLEYNRDYIQNFNFGSEKLFNCNYLIILSFNF